MRKYLEAIPQQQAINALSTNLERLTPREREVLKSMLDADPVKGTAHVLGISVGGAAVHRSRVLEKLLARNQPDLIKMVACSSNRALLGSKNEREE